MAKKKQFKKAKRKVAKKTIVTKPILLQETSGYNGK